MKDKELRKAVLALYNELDNAVGLADKQDVIETPAGEMIRRLVGKPQ